MQIKWLEDFIALAQTGSFTQAAEQRHVTHPAFGRRIKALEAWAGVPLVERRGTPVRLTPAGQSLLDTATGLVQGLDGSREELRAAAGRRERTVTLTTGRTLARTLLADWLVRLRPVLRDGELRVTTRALAETVQLLERGEVDFSLIYHHPSLALRLDARRFSFLTLASDRLVPVARADAQGRPSPAFGDKPAPYIGYAPTLALGRLVDDHLAQNAHAPRLARWVECDSADAVYEYVRKGLGVAWLPWSMVHADCAASRLAVAGDRRLEVHFDVRLYRPKRRLAPMAEAVWQAFAGR